MVDPQLSIQQAFYQALTTPALLRDASTFPVVVHAQAGSQEYLLLSQCTSVQTSASAACREWNCTLLLTIVTRFEQANLVSEIPAYDLSEQVFSRLVDQRLDLVGGFSMSPIEVALANNLHEYDQQAVNVLRYLRLRFSVYQT